MSSWTSEQGTKNKSRSFSSTGYDLTAYRLISPRLSSLVCESRYLAFRLIRAIYHRAPCIIIVSPKKKVASEKHPKNVLRDGETPQQQHQQRTHTTFWPRVDDRRFPSLLPLRACCSSLPSCRGVSRCSGPSRTHTHKCSLSSSSSPLWLDLGAQTLKPTLFLSLATIIPPSLKSIPDLVNSPSSDHHRIINLHTHTLDHHHSRPSSYPTIEGVDQHPNDPSLTAAESPRRVV